MSAVNLNNVINVDDSNVINPATNVGVTNEQYNQLTDIITESGITRVNFNIDTNFFSTIELQRVYKNIKFGNVVKEGDYSESSDKLKITLMPHQKRILTEMLEKENITHRVTSGINSFVLSDKVGSGKSIDILALICKKPNVDNIMSNSLKYKPNLYANFRGFKFKETVNIKSNVIIVPHGIYNQWLDYITKYTNLTVLSVKSKIDIDKLDKPKIQELVSNPYDIILIKSTKYKDFMKCLYGTYPYSILIKKIEEGCLDKVKISLDKIKKLAYHSTYHNQISSNLINNINMIKEYINGIDMEELENTIKSSGNYKLEWVKYYKGPIFERIFIDEANSIKIPNMEPIYGKVNWFITSSLEDLFFPNGRRSLSSGKILINGIKGNGFIKQVFKDNCSKNLVNFLQDMYIKNNDEYITQSFNLPQYIEHKIPCFTPNEVKVLHGVALPEIMNALNAGDIASAIKYTGCETNTKETIIDRVLYDMNISLAKKKEILTEKQGQMLILEGLPDNEENKNKKKNLQKSIKLYTDSISDITHKIECVKQRIKDTENKDCPICANTISNDCITPCCNNRFCFECIITSLTYSNKKECPLCRSKIDLNKLITIQDEKDIVKKDDKLPTKLETLLTIIKNNPKGKYLIFSEFDHTLNTILQKFNDNNILYDKLMGSSGHITNLIKQYSEGKINALLLNAKHFGSGLNLQMTSDVIIYHRMSKDLEAQIIGRAQRPGRNTSLNVHYLCYENEI